MMIVVLLCFHQFFQLFQLLLPSLLHQLGGITISSFKYNIFIAQCLFILDVLTMTTQGYPVFMIVLAISLRDWMVNSFDPHKIA
jgi:hypothetical protein